MAGTWSDLTNAPPADVSTTFLLTDGTVLAQGVSTNKWYRLTPDGNGSYANGSWSERADSVNGPLYYASGILRDGRLIVCGGEYNFGDPVWLNAAEMYNPVANTWTTLPTPAGWSSIGDSPGCVLPDGRFFLGEVTTRHTAIYDPATNAWTAAADKISRVGEESWSLLFDGSIHAVDCYDAPNAEKYVIAADEWVEAGATGHVLVDDIHEIGASVLLPDGRLFVIGATGFTALYTAPPISNQPGTWANGPTIPEVNPGEALGTVDAPACLLPNGRVLFSAGPITDPASFQPPTYFFEYDPETNSISAAPTSNPINSNTKPYHGRMLMLPTGQVLYTQDTSKVELYTPDGTYDPVWRPTITKCPALLQRGRSHTLTGRQINGLSQCVYYGNDATQATNYPIVRLESTSGSAVVYCRTFNFSTMGLQTGTVVHTCRYTVPSSTPTGKYNLVVIANGIPSKACHVQVINKRFKELKHEIKEKLEISEFHKRLLDVQKPVREFDDKIIREEFELFEKFEEEWLHTVRAVSSQLEEVQQEMKRSFIKPEERPEVGITPEPEIEPIRPRKLSAEDARIGQIKEAFNDGRKEKAFSKEAEAFRQRVHNPTKKGGDTISKKQSVKSASKKTSRKRGPN